MLMPIFEELLKSKEPGRLYEQLSVLPGFLEPSVTFGALKRMPPISDSFVLKDIAVSRLLPLDLLSKSATVQLL